MRDISDKNYFFSMERYAQGFADDLCGVKCLQSIYEFYEQKKDVSYFIRELALADELAFLPQLMKLMHRDNFSVNIHISNPYIFDLSWEILTSAEKVSRLEKRYNFIKESKWKRVILEYILYLKEGGSVSQEVISEKLMKNLLSEQRIILAFVDNVIFHQRGRRYWDDEKYTYEPDDIRGGSDGHAVVVNGWDEKKGFHIVDSSQIQHYSQNGQFWIAPEILIAGIYTLSGEIASISNSNKI